MVRNNTTARRLGKRFGPPLALLLAVAVAAAPSPAFAQDSAAAEVLFLEAKELIGQKKFAEACPKLEASLKLDRTVGTLMNLADCHESLGKIATAWGEWGSAFEWLKRDGDNRAAYAEERRRALTPRLPNLRIDVKSEAPSLDVYRGSLKIDPAAYNTALPVDPGPHVIQVRRGDLVLKEERVEAVEGATANTVIDLAAIEKSVPPPPPPKPGSTPPLPPSTSQRTAGFVVGGIGAGTLIVGGVLGIVAIRTMERAREPDACIELFCSPDGIKAVERARTFAEAGQWVGLGGLVMLGVGATLILTAPGATTTIGSAAPSGVASVRAAPWIGPTGGGVSLEGRLW